MHPGDHGEDIGEYGPIYRAIERGLWALGPALILYLLITYPSTQAARQQAAIQTDMAMAAENAEHCIKWGMPTKSAEHLSCVRDLVAIRARSEQRVRDETASDF